MELSVKYQYTYFLYPYTVDVDKYQKYLLKLLKNEKCRLKIFEKEKDLDIYNYFSTNVKNSFFPTFELRGSKLKEFKEYNDERKSRILSEYPCTVFEYDISSYRAEGKEDTRKRENYILFDVSKIEIICFNTGVCFISLKTTVEDTEKFSDVLNFNYKFREMYSEFNKLKQYENINIKTNSFEDLNNYPLILQKEESNSRKLLDYIALNNNVKLIPKMEVVSQELITEFTNIGLGIGFVIIDLAKRNFNDLEELKLNKKIPNINVYLATNKSISLTFASKTFIKYIK